MHRPFSGKRGDTERLCGNFRVKYVKNENWASDPLLMRGGGKRMPPPLYASYVDTVRYFEMLINTFIESDSWAVFPVCRHRLDISTRLATTH